MKGSRHGELKNISFAPATFTMRGDTEKRKKKSVDDDDGGNP